MGLTMVGNCKYLRRGNESLLKDCEDLKRVSSDLSRIIEGFSEEVEKKGKEKKSTETYPYVMGL